MPFIFENLRLSNQVYQLSSKTIIINGPDSAQYLHSQTTNDVASLELNSFQFSSILDIYGKIISSFILCKMDSSQFKIIVNEKFIDSTLERIEKYHIAEDFEVEVISEIPLLKINSNEEGIKGTYFFEGDTIVFSKEPVVCTEPQSYSSLKVLTGVPDLGLEVSAGTLINNTRFDELSVNYQKGCYPGQETVSKINTRRGASYKTILLILDEAHSFVPGPITKNDKKIGELKISAIINGKTYLSLSLIRELRIDQSTLEFKLDSNEYSGTLHYYPYLKPDKASLAIDLYDHAIERFHSRDDENAITYLYKAIEHKKNFADAYECLGVLYGRIGNFDKAIELMEQLKEIDPKCMMAYTNLSLYHMKIGNIDIAEKYKSDATFLNFQVLGDEADLKRKEEELSQKKLSERDRREGMFEQVLEMDPEDSMANNGMGEIEFERKNFEISEKYFSAAIQGNQKYSVAYLGLAKSLYFQSKMEESKKILIKGIEVAGKNGDLMPANEMQSLFGKLK